MPLSRRADMHALRTVWGRSLATHQTFELWPETFPHATGVCRFIAADCRETFESLALALTLAIDPQFLIRPAEAIAAEEPAPVSTVVVEQAPAPAPTRTPPPVRAGPALTLTAYAGALGTVGLSPAPTAGGKLGVGLRYGLFAFYVEGRGDAPVWITTAVGLVRTNVFLGTVLPCLEWHGLSGCVSVSAGALQVEGDFIFGRREASAVVKVGLRLQYQWLPFRHFGFFGQVDVGGLASRVTVFANQMAVWSTSPVAGEIAAGLMVPF